MNFLRANVTAYVTAYGTMNALIRYHMFIFLTAYACVLRLARTELCGSL
nr:unnamed protein product [Callosobruchus analis]